MPKSNQIQTISQPTELVLMTNTKEPRIDSRLVANKMGIKHKNLYELITKHKKEMKEIGSLVTFETEAVKTETSRGVKKLRFYALNENQLDLISRLVRGKNKETMLAYKVALTKLFSAERKRKQAIADNKADYHLSLDLLKEKANVKHYHYINLAKTENKMLGLRAGGRGQASHSQVGLLSAVQQISVSVLNSIDNPSEAIREISRRGQILADLFAPVTVSHINNKITNYGE